MGSVLTFGRPEAAHQPQCHPGHADYWLEALRLVAQYYRLPLSVQKAKLAVAAEGDKAAIETKLHAIARSMGLGVKLVETKNINFSSWHVPFILELTDGQVVVVHKISKDREAAVWLSGEQRLEQVHMLDELLAKTRRVLLARPARTVPDARVDAYIRPFRENWLRRIVFRDYGSYVHVVVASLIANTLGLAGIIFSMQVYDRVVPAQSFNTLYVLFSGVLLALFFDFMMRRARMGIIDMLGKRTDLEMSDVVFGHALRVRNRARPTSTGSFIAQLRDVEQVRELLTSTTVSAIADLPFFFCSSHCSAGWRDPLSLSR
ncbi:hypothetical protein LWV33_07355 [Brucella intermedia]